MIPVVFDLDGTLGDTEELVIRAYELIGVSVPEDAWGQPASLWLPQLVGDKDLAAELHALKNIAYRVLVNVDGVKPLAASGLCKELNDTTDYDVSILTGASYDAAVAVRRALSLDDVTFLGTGVAVDRKIEMLQDVAQTGLYFDDNLDACERVSDETQWQVLYIEKTATLDDLVRGFKEAVCRCKQ